MYTKLIVGLTCIFISSCMSVNGFETLPQGVFVNDTELAEPAVIAIKAINEGLGRIYQVLYTSETDYSITVECDKNNEILEGKDGRCLYDFNDDGFITVARVLVKCEEGKWPRQSAAYVIAHELYHCLGFDEHSSNSDCLNADLVYIQLTAGQDVTVEDIKSRMCQEMIDQFDSTYYH